MKKLPTPSLDRVKSLASFAPAILSGSILLLASISPSHAALAPGCVITKDLKQGFYIAEDAVTVVNNCASTQRVKVVLSFAKDLKCATLASRASLRFKWTFGGFDRLEKC
jgi:hypothetical protein